MIDYKRFQDKLTSDHHVKMKEHRKLFEEGKEDESRFAKIEANVIEIANTILKHRVTTFKDESELVESYKLGLNNLLIPWEHQKQLAQDSEDFENEHIESLKIAKIHEIIHAFDKFVGA